MRIRSSKVLALHANEHLCRLLVLRSNSKKVFFHSKISWHKAFSHPLFPTDRKIRLVILLPP